MKRIHNPEVRIAKMLKELGPLGLWATGAKYCTSGCSEEWRIRNHLGWTVRENRQYMRILHKHNPRTSIRRAGWNCWHGHTRYSTEEKAIKRELQRRRKLASR